MLEVEVGVVGGAALVEAEDPDVGLLHLLERADEVGDAGDADVLGGSGGGFGDGRGDGGGAALGEDDAVDAGAVGGAEEGAEVVGVFDAVEGEEEAVAAVGRRGEQVFDGEEVALANEGDDALVGVGSGEPGELVAGLERRRGHRRRGRAARRSSLASRRSRAMEMRSSRPGAGADGLLDRVEAVKNFHRLSLPAENTGEVRH